jgi:hypothetical protein
VSGAVTRGRLVAGAALLSAVLVAGLALTTNSLDTARFSWDFRYYIRMAQSPFAPPLASPFAYRFATPLLVYALSNAFSLSVEAGFRALAYGAGVLQLLGVFLFTNWFTRSAKGAYVALLVTAFSLFNVKFLLFDVYRPDHLAYVLMLLQTYFALERRFWPLLLVTMLACQVREFNVVPLLAYLFAFSRTQPEASAVPKRRTMPSEVLISAVGLVAALGLPRLLIPVAEDYQFASLTRDGLLRMLLAPFVLPRDANFLYSVVAYLLPSLMLAGITEAASALGSLSRPNRRYLLVYSGLVLVLSFLGGTDFYRFSSYLFLPQAIFVALVVKKSQLWPVGIMLAGMIVFNRLWRPFPMSDVGTYLDFYGGFGTRFGWPSVLRILECLAFIGVGMLSRGLFRSVGPRSSPVIS